MDVNLRILVADAHAGMRGIIVSLLGAEFDVVGAVSGGEQLVKAAIELKPDVIVSDIYMPKLTGIEAQESLQALGINIPFVFCQRKPLFHAESNETPRTVRYERRSRIEFERRSSSIHCP